MEVLFAPAPDRGDAASFWKNPSVWFRQKNLSRGYWIFFSAAFFFDAGFSVYFFLFNLYLLDCHFNERAMGWVGGAMTLGSLAGTLPAGALARRIGLRPVLIFLFVSAPILNAFRALWIWEPAQIGLAFLAGLAMSCWGICFLSGVARLTTEQSRTAAFSLIFSASVGTSMLGGIVCSYLRQWLGMAGIAMQAAETKRLILLVSCGIVLLGLFPVLQLRMPSLCKKETIRESVSDHRHWLRKWTLHPFLRRFLPLMALWCAVLAAFNPFANVYLSRDLKIPMTQIGLIFSAAQVVQLCMGLIAPLIFRILGLIKGIAATQVAAAFLLFSLAGTRSEEFAIALYLTFSAAQWMSSPGLYNLLMDETPDEDRSTAAAMALFCNALIGSAATAGSGVLFTRFGYPPVLIGISTVALAAALLFLAFISPQRWVTPKAIAG
jgi:predicted MFS family arabinose efflux permease